MAAQDSSAVTTPEIRFKAILRVSSKVISSTNVIQGHCVAALHEGQQQRRLQPAGATRGIIKGTGTALSLSLAGASLQQESSPANEGNVKLGAYHISPSCLETAMRSHIKKSILTVHIEVFLLYYARLCLAAQNYSCF